MLFNGGVAQSGRAVGSYPACHRFKSCPRYHLKASRMRYILIFLLIFSLSGCATIMTGPNQKVEVTSLPDKTAFRVDDKDSYITPAKIKLKRNRDHTLVFTKEGYETETVKLVHAISGAFCGNVFLGGPVGMALDAWSGSEFKLVPTSVHVDMKKEAVKDTHA